MDYNMLCENVMQRIQPLIEDMIDGYDIDKKKFDVNPDQVMKDTEKPIPSQDKPQYNDIKRILDRMHRQYKFNDVLGSFATDVDWSDTIATACTAADGMLIFNPDFAKKVLDMGEKTVEFVILHEAMHKYLEAQGKQKQIKSVKDNVEADKLVNTELIRKWPEYRQPAEELHAIL